MVAGQRGDGRLDSCDRGRLVGLLDEKVHAALGAPFVVTTVLATLQGFNHNLVRASLSLGAGPLQTFFRVTLPVIAPGVISGALFAFLTSFDELMIPLFLGGPRAQTLAVRIWNSVTPITIKNRMKDSAAAQPSRW